MNSASPANRSISIARETKETQINLRLAIDGPTTDFSTRISTGIGFFDHMIEAFAKHAGVTLELKCVGDLHIDQHHTVEDVGIVLGQAVAKILGDCAGIERFALMECPLDEALSKVVIDISGRPFLHFGAQFRRPWIGQLDSSLLREFFSGFVLHARWTVHIDVLRGENDHHIAESIFKAFARAAKIAWKQTGDKDIPSTKGSLV
ncbi:imidazoleglycerol-phosphate dehydratase HisB [bacterium]|nr:imidazoleglycerol-phosphate dehydratase HisB [bacterium]